jgi:hypothetical protein
MEPEREAAVTAGYMEPEMETVVKTCYVLLDTYMELCKYMGAADSAFYIELCSSVRYDVDRCTKNKRMIRILGQGFFL